MTQTMKQKLLIALFIISGLSFSGCEKGTTNANGKIEIYLIDQFEKVENTLQIKESGIVLKNTPLVEFEDILSYTPSTYTFKLSEKGSTAIQNLQHSVFGVAFAVVANNEIIYSAYFWPLYSSLSCDWITADPLSLKIKNELYVKLGYPGLLENQSISDKRNDKRILEIFKNAGKLIILNL